MPNWCNNTLRITGPEADIEAFKKKAVGHSPWHKPPEGEEPDALNFHSLLPVPDDVLAAGYEAAGYDWERDHWGCKWGACHAELIDEWDGCVCYSFDTAWSPPIEFCQSVARQWPTLTFILEYEEGGMGFKGLARFEGETHEDHCINC